MTDYTTTRGGPTTGLAEAVFRGMPPDGGLYVPAQLPDLDAASALSDEPPSGVPFPARGLADVGWRVGSAFFPELSPAVLERIVRRAFDFPVPLVEVEPHRYVLELFHGPTHAFKDVGARFMASLMAALEVEAPGERTVLVATSGDTGGAVASAFHGLPGYRVVTLFPADGISARQRRQMTTLGGNVHALAVRGSFDDCQRMAKEAFADRELAEAFRLTSANSINIGRLLPQAFYYVHAVRQLGVWPLSARAQQSGAPRFIVPSGNLGNLCSGLMAQRAGLPCGGFVAASNANDGFVRYLGGESFESRPSTATLSSAMDVGAPSNLERILWLLGDDASVRAAVDGVSVSDAETRACIRDTYERTGYALDPHTAVGYRAAESRGASPDRPVVVLGTAHPAKFPETVESAIGRAVDTPQALREVETGTERMDTVAPSLDALADTLATVLR